MIRFEDTLPARGELRTERTVESRHVRTFSEPEIMQLLQEAVLRQAGHDPDEIAGSSARIASPLGIGPITVRVTVTERFG